jgi:hypothetical protein
VSNVTYTNRKEIVSLKILFISTGITPVSYPSEKIIFYLGVKRGVMGVELFSSEKPEG